MCQLLTSYGQFVTVSQALIFCCGQSCGPGFRLQEALDKKPDPDLILIKVTLEMFSTKIAEKFEKH